MAWFKFEFDIKESITDNHNIICKYATGKTGSQINKKSKKTATAANISAIDDHFPQFDKYYIQKNDVF